MKTKIASIISISMIIAPVMAQNLDSQVFANQNVKAIELSQAEMKETQGEMLPFVAAIAAGGAYSSWKYHYDVYKQTGHIGTSQGAAIAAAVGSASIGVGKGMGAASGGGIGAAMGWGAGTSALNYGAQKANVSHTIRR